MAIWRRRYTYAKSLQPDHSPVELAVELERHVVFELTGVPM
jgi:hypothetical protein